jgi:hypothetical protein
MANSGESAPEGPGGSRHGDPPSHGGAGSAAPALPQRIGGITPSAMTADRTRRLASPELLQRVIEGLRQL